MAAQDQFQGKYMEGTFAGGEGPVLGQSVKTESEEKGVLGTDQTSGHKLNAVSGKSAEMTKGSEDKGFDLHSKSYAGPENWMPTDKGEVNPFDIH